MTTDRLLLLERLRIDRGWTQSELAARCGLSRETVRNIELGTSQITYAPTIKALADALGLVPAELAADLRAERAERAAA